jgi:5'-nucleotidase
MNPGGIRADDTCGSYPCPITWGTLYGIQPFANNLVSMQIKGSDLLTALEQQWQSHPTGSPCPVVQPTNTLQVSGLSFTWSSAAVDAPTCLHHIQQASVGGVAIDPNALYTMTSNSFLAAGGDSFFSLRNGFGRATGPVDLDALVAYVQAHSPVNQQIEGRLLRTY